MRAAALKRAASTVALMVVTGCAGVPVSAPTRPPLAGDLTGGTPLRLAAADQWSIGAGRAFVATDEGTVMAIELATGAIAWQESFTRGDPWDSQPTLALSANQDTVVALRTVDFEGSSRLDLLLLDAASGAARAEHLIVDPHRKWRVDLPPRVLAADADTVVLSANPESGRQSAVVSVATGELLWQVDEEAVAATADLVVTRGAGWGRADGIRRWRAVEPVGPMLAQGPSSIVVGLTSVAVWLDPASGRELARSDRLSEAEPGCAHTTDVLVCLGTGVTGYRLSDGKRLWSSSQAAESVTTVLDWAYLGNGSGRGDVLEARSGQVLEPDVELPAIRYADRTGVLLAATQGYRWVSLTR